MYVCAGTRLEKGIGFPSLDMEVLIAVNHPAWVLGTSLRSSESAASTLNSQVMAPTHHHFRFPLSGQSGPSLRLPISFMPCGS